MAVLAVVNERSACNVNVSFHLFDGTEVIPDSGVYRIDDTSGIEIKDDTNFIPTTSTYTISISALENRILRGCVFETRVLTLKWFYAGNEFNDNYQYSVKNLKFVS